MSTDKDPREVSEVAVRAARDVRVCMSRLRRRIRETQDRAELTASQIALLGRLDREGSRTVTELAAAEGVRHQSVTVSVAGLVRHGLIDRVAHPTDGRRQLVSLSAEGREFLSSKRAEGVQWLAHALHRHLSDDEKRTVIDAMALLERVTRS